MTASTAAENVAAAGNAAAIEGLSADANLSYVKAHYTFKPPIEIFLPPKGDDDEEIEPLIDIMVVDELLDPYREQLAEEMVGRIDDAIAVLSGPGGIFIGSNRYTAFNKSISNAFTLNAFLWQGANFGTLNIGDLLQLILTAVPPTFYVVFARRCPPVVRRPCRSGPDFGSRPTCL